MRLEAQKADDNGGAAKGIDQLCVRMGLVHEDRLNAMFNLLSTSCVTTPLLAPGQWGMSAMHPTMKRLYAAARDRGVTTQAALAARLNTSSQRVKNWESRGISQQGANEAQAVMGVSSTWILDGAGAQDASASQPARPDFRKVADSITVLQEYLAITGNPPEWIADEVLLEVAYSVVEASSEPVSQTNVIDLTKRLAERVRNAERSDEGTGAEAGEKDGRAPGRTAAAARRRPK